jgi:diguanylate cyclase (GGDEF)-like protein
VRALGSCRRRGAVELLLWRWSTLVQITSDLIIAVFFIVLVRSVRREELQCWVGGWLANLAALLVTIGFWLLQPRAPIVFAMVSALYIFTKTTFVILLALGSVAFTARRASVPYQHVLIGAALLALCGGVFVHSIDQLGVIEGSTISMCLASGALFLCIEKPPGYGWLAMGFAVRSTLAAAETVAYAEHAVSDGANPSPLLATFLASHSSFDTGAEWMIALGCVLMLYRTIQQELVRTNNDLRLAQSELRAMLDHDQLTGVLNRHSLPGLLRAGQITGAALLFCDLDGFKQINDAHGHHVGDQCLRRFARALRESFRPEDHVVRHGGDEFLVICADIDEADAAARIEAARAHVNDANRDGPPVRFSVGLSWLTAQGDAEAALRAADAAMYRAKKATEARGANDYLNLVTN